jgi:RecB family endonuclease NucS
MIDITKPFVIYATCTVEYEGRACSTLDEGNYIILYKKDKSLLIHSGDKSTPINYQPSGTLLHLDGQQILARRKSEMIKITMRQIIHYACLENWSINELKIRKTERELVNKIVNNMSDYIDREGVVTCEYPTELGKIDIMLEEKGGVKHIIEVKRCKATINHCVQLEKYYNAIGEPQSRLYIAAPSIANSALNYAKSKNIKYIEVLFD